LVAGPGDCRRPALRGGGAGRGLGDRNRQARGAPAPTRRTGRGARRHGHAKEVAVTLGQRYGSAGTRVKPRRAVGTVSRTDRSSDVPRRIQADTPVVDRIRAPDDCQGRLGVVGFEAYEPRPPMHRLWTNVWTTGHRSPGQVTAEGRPARWCGSRAAPG
jgi:hypothetical protein